MDMDIILIYYTKKRPNACSCIHIWHLGAVNIWLLGVYRTLRSVSNIYKFEEGWIFSHLSYKFQQMMFIFQADENSISLSNCFYRFCWYNLKHLDSLSVEYCWFKPTKQTRDISTDRTVEFDVRKERLLSLWK